MDNESSAEVYSRLLLKKLQGFPLYVPEPYGNMGAFCDKGVRLGDVGIVDSDGAFDYLFNACLPANHRVNLGRKLPGGPQGFRHLQLDTVQDLTYNNNAWTAPAKITSERMSAIDFGAQAGIDPGVAALVGAGAGARFTSKASEGAALYMPHGGSRYLIKNLTALRQHALEHAMQWYEFVNGELGREVSNYSLYVITGCDKTSVWANASFANAGRGMEVALDVKAVSVAQAGMSYNYIWVTQNSVDRRTSPPRPDSDTRQNQCVAIRGFKLAVHPDSTLRKLMGRDVRIMDVESSGAKKSGYKPFNPGSRYRGGGGGANLDRRRSGGSQGSGSGTSHALGSATPEGPLEESAVSIEHIPEYAELYHPLDIINKHLLEILPNTKVVITHDDDWSTLTDVPDDFPTNPESLIEIIKSRYDWIEEGDYVYLEHRVDLEPVEEHSEGGVTHLLPSVPSAASYDESVEGNFPPSFDEDIDPYAMDDDDEYYQAPAQPSDKGKSKEESGPSFADRAQYENIATVLENKTKRAQEIANEATRVDRAADNFPLALEKYSQSVKLLGEIIDIYESNTSGVTGPEKEAQLRRFSAIHDTYEDRIKIIRTTYNIPDTPASEQALKEQLETGILSPGSSTVPEMSSSSAGLDRKGKGRGE